MIVYFVYSSFLAKTALRTNSTTKWINLLRWLHFHNFKLVHLRYTTVNSIRNLAKDEERKNKKKLQKWPKRSYYAKNERRDWVFVYIFVTWSTTKKRVDQVEQLHALHDSFFFRFLTLLSLVRWFIIEIDLFSVRKWTATRHTTDKRRFCSMAFWILSIDLIVNPIKITYF